MVSSRRLWFGVLSAPAAWLVALLAGYAVASRACETAPNGLHLRPATGLNYLLVVLAVALLAIALGGLWAARGSFRAIDQASSRRIDTGTAPENAHGRGRPAMSTLLGRARFMSFAGILVAILFAFGIVLFGLAPLALSSCTQAH